MSRDTRWAAPYQFLEECWRGQDRVLLDADLERVLVDGGLDGSSLAHDPVASLLDLLLPSHPSDGQAWFVLGPGRRADALARRRPSARFVSLDDARELAAAEPWRLAMVNLAGWAAPEIDAAGALSEAIDPGVMRVIDGLVARVSAGGPGRMLALHLPLRLAPGDAGEADAETLDAVVDRFAELVDARMPGARLYGVAWPSMAAVYRLGDPEAETDPVEAYEAELDAAEASWRDDDETAIYAPGDDDLPIDYDNSRADPAPRFRSLLAVLGPEVVVAGLGEGLTLLELAGGAASATHKPVAEETPGTPGRELSALRSQLQEARHEAQTMAVERQRLIEELDETRERLAELETELGDGAGGPSTEVAAGGRRLDLALAERQQLRWELDRALERVAELEGRPVHALEAEIARLRAEADSGARGPGRNEGQGHDAAAEPGSEGRERDPEARGAEGARAGAAGLRARLAGHVDRLLRRVERGGISGIELHRALRRLRQGLSRL